MLNLPNYAGVLRCIGQALENHGIEVFELRNHANEFRVLGADPNPPYTDLIELNFSLQNIEVLDREGQARRGRSTTDVGFDNIPEMLRAIGKYIDNKRGPLRRIDNSCPSDSDDPIVQIEYQSRTGDVQTENLPMSLIREISVQMYKGRTRI